MANTLTISFTPSTVAPVNGYIITYFPTSNPSDITTLTVYSSPVVIPNLPENSYGATITGWCRATNYSNTLATPTIYTPCNLICSIVSGDATNALGNNGSATISVNSPTDCRILWTSDGLLQPNANVNKTSFTRTDLAIGENYFIVTNIVTGCVYEDVVKINNGFTCTNKINSITAIPDVTTKDGTYITSSISVSNTATLPSGYHYLYTITNIKTNAQISFLDNATIPTFNGLNPGTTYTFTISSVIQNGNGVVVQSTPCNIGNYFYTVPNCPATPSDITGFSITSINSTDPFDTSGSISITIPNLTNYTISWMYNGVVFSPTSIISGNVLTISNLTHGLYTYTIKNNTTYCKVFNTITINDSYICPTTQWLSAVVTGATVDKNNNATVTLNTTPFFNVPIITGYNITYTYTCSGGGYVPNSNIFTGLTGGITYTFTCTINITNTSLPNYTPKTCTNTLTVVPSGYYCGTTYLQSLVSITPITNGNNGVLTINIPNTTDDFTVELTRNTSVHVAANTVPNVTFNNLSWQYNYLLTLINNTHNCTYTQGFLIPDQTVMDTFNIQNQICNNDNTITLNIGTIGSHTYNFFQDAQTPLCNIHAISTYSITGNITGTVIDNLGSTYTINTTNGILFTVDSRTGTTRISEGICNIGCTSCTAPCTQCFSCTSANCGQYYPPYPIAINTTNQGTFQIVNTIDFYYDNLGGQTTQKYATISCTGNSFTTSPCTTTQGFVSSEILGGFINTGSHAIIPTGSSKIEIFSSRNDLSFKWGNGETTQTISNLHAGTKSSVLVIDNYSSGKLGRKIQKLLISDPIPLLSDVIVDNQSLSGVTIKSISGISGFNYFGSLLQGNSYTGSHDSNNDVKLTIKVTRTNITEWHTKISVYLNNDPTTEFISQNIVNGVNVISIPTDSYSLKDVINIKFYRHA
jgi:hypothetical protein